MAEMMKLARRQLQEVFELTHIGICIKSIAKIIVIRYFKVTKSRVYSKVRFRGKTSPFFKIYLNKYGFSLMTTGQNLAHGNSAALFNLGC